MKKIRAVQFGEKQQHHIAIVLTDIGILFCISENYHFRDVQYTFDSVNTDNYLLLMADSDRISFLITCLTRLSCPRAVK